MKYLDRFLKSNDLSSVPSVPSLETFHFSEEEEEEKSLTFKTDTADKADKSPLPSVLSVTESSVSPASERYVQGPEVCSWCGIAIVTVPGVLALARRTTVGDLLHPKCWAESTRDPGNHQPRTPDLDAAIARANSRAEREGK